MSGFEMVVEMRPSPYVLVAELEGLALGLERFKTPLSRAVVKVLAPSIATNFAIGGRPPWQPLSDGTIAVRDLLMHVGSKPLIVTGQLEAVASSPSVWEVGEDYAQVSGLNGAEYGIVHQFGADTSGNGAIIPARPFIDIQDSDANAIEIIIDEWVAELLLAAGFVASVTGVGEDAGGLSGASN